MRRIRGRASIADVKALTVADAVAIYKRHYFERPKISQLPQPLWATVFDMQINAGGNAIRILQRVVREFGENISVDGALGPQSIAATRRVFEKAGQYLVDAYGIARRNYYFSIADRRPKSRKYARSRSGGKGGWIRRAEEFMQFKYQLTDAQFKRRVSKWA